MTINTGRDIQSFETTQENNDVNNSYHEHQQLQGAVRFLPRWMRFEYGPIEANGLAVDIFARATISMSSMFLGPALLELAMDAARRACLVESSSNTEQSCGKDAKIHGFRPSSLLSNIAIASGLLCSVGLPFTGAVVDHSPYRRQIGAYTAAFLVVLKSTETIVGSRTWLFVAFLQIATGALYSFHNTAIFAYTSDLSSDAKQQAAYNTSLTVIMFISTLFFLVLVVSIAHFLNVGDVGTARISQIITATTSSICFAFAWKYLFRDRPALSQVPPGMSLWTCGFYKVLRSVTRIRIYFPALVWLMAAIAFGEAASSALITIATTFMKQVLEMNASEISLVFLVVLVSGIPGSRIAAYLASRHWNPLHSMILCNVVFLISTSFAALSLTGPHVKHLSYVFGVPWGMGIGWLFPIEISAYVSLIEKGQEAEMMGIFLLLGQVLSWLPPLVFTMINEGGLSMSLGLGSVGLFFCLAILCLLCMGSYEDALHTLESAYTSPRANESEMGSSASFRPVKGDEDEKPLPGVLS